MPLLANLGADPRAAVRDRMLPLGRSLTSRRVPSSHGGPYTTSTGETVTVLVSDSYPVDESVNKKWAEFVAGLVHGTEIAKVTVLVSTLDEMQRACGSTEADACYDPNPQQLIVPGEPTPDGAPVEELVAHEYGHHVARNRNNAPFLAYTWGTKRWASYENVCLRTTQGTAFPGDEGAHYYLNPGEAFAETYRRLNDERFGTVGRFPWNADASFMPDATALSLLELDVRRPWTGPAKTSWRGSIAAGRTKMVPLATPRDGYMLLTLSAPAGSAVGVFEQTGAKVLTAAHRQIRFGICGERRLKLAVYSPRAGRFSVAISKP